MKRPVRNGPPDTSKAWIAGWDASLTFTSNRYKRRDYSNAFTRGREAGKRSSAEDVKALQRRLAARPHSQPFTEDRT